MSRASNVISCYICVKDALSTVIGFSSDVDFILSFWLTTVWEALSLAFV